jgi:hypothetical protein
MTAYRVVYDDGAYRVVMAHDIVEALRLGRLFSSSTIKVVTHA